MQYNQTSKGQSVRIGNWFEELKLKEDTGIRFYPNPKAKDSSLLTKERCIVHTEQMDPRDYTSVSRASIIDPRKHPDSKYTTQAVGPRKMRFETTVKKMIEDDVQQRNKSDFEQSRKLSYSTTNGETFFKPGFANSLRDNDIDVRLPTRNTDYSTDDAITIYSYKVQDTTEKVDFPTTFVGSMNPFRKNCVFSADIEKDVFSTRTETAERPKPLPTVQDFKNLLQIRTNLLHTARRMLTESLGRSPDPGATVRMIIGELSASKAHHLPIEDVEDLLRNRFEGFTLTDSDRIAMLRAYDLTNMDSIAMEDFRLLFKRTPSPRRMELIGYFYSLIEAPYEGSSEQATFLDTIEMRLKVANVPVHPLAKAFLLQLRNAGVVDCSANHFFNYYVEASSELEQDERFEELLKTTWEALMY